jgi:hypothetical protein
VKRLLEYPRGARFAGHLHAVKLNKNIAKLSSVYPRVPTVCLAADWWPNPWLGADAQRRKEVVKKFEDVYWQPPPALAISSLNPSLTVDDLEAWRKLAMWCKSAAVDNQQGRQVELYLLAVDWSEKPTRIKKRFGRWLEAQMPKNVKKTPSTKSQDKSKKTAEDSTNWLKWLSLYRISKLPAKKRDEFRELFCKAMNRKRLSDPTISKARKRIKDELKARNY